jgi:Acetyltransferase (GNAT) family
MTTARRDFPRSARLAVARKDSEVVGVASIKPIRKDYATGVADKAKFVFDSKTPELGYVVVGPGHRNHGLSSDMAARCSRRLPTLR